MKRALPALDAAGRRLLLHASRLEIRAGRTAELLREPLDWEAVAFHAQLHSVASLLLRQLDAPGVSDAVPDRVRRLLLPVVHGADYRNRIFARENAALLEALSEADVPALVPKGLSLLETVYGSLALRPLIDLVFLVPEDRRARARELFLERGYFQKLPRPIDGLYRWSCPQLLFERFDGLRLQALVVWDLMTWPRLHALETSGFWRRARPGVLTGHKCLLLSPEDQILYLCLQADNHGYFNRPALHSVEPEELLFAEWSNNRLIRFVDIHEAVRALDGGLDWDRLARRAAQGGVEESVHASLRLTEALLGPAAPPSALRQLRAPRARGVRRFALEAMVPSQRSRGRHPGRGLVGSAMRRLSPYWQIRVARLIGLLEFAFPERRLLRLRDGPRPAALEIAAWVRHAGAALVRSLYTPLSLWTAQAVRRPGARTLGHFEKAEGR